MQKFAAAMSMAEKPGLSSEEGEPVVYTKSQISELIKELKKYVK